MPAQIWVSVMLWVRFSESGKAETTVLLVLGEGRDVWKVEAAHV